MAVVRMNERELAVEVQAEEWLIAFGWPPRSRNVRVRADCRESQLAVWNANPFAPWRVAAKRGCTSACSIGCEHDEALAAIDELDDFDALVRVRRTR